MEALVTGGEAVLGTERGKERERERASIFDLDSPDVFFRCSPMSEGQTEGTGPALCHLIAKTIRTAKNLLLLLPPHSTFSPMVWPGVESGVTDPSGDGWNGCWTLVRMILEKSEQQRDQSITSIDLRFFFLFLFFASPFTPPHACTNAPSIPFLWGGVYKRPLYPSPLHPSIIPASLHSSQIANLGALGPIWRPLRGAEWRGRIPPPPTAPHEIVDSIWLDCGALEI